ncbi:MAG: ABC transporter permease [Leptolyngbyaceae bacterium]|nr:ABC transporter permease [Leptolyngbyaceae bacterium]
MNIQRVWVIAQNVFREVIRDRILYLIGFFAIILVVIALLLPQISANTQDKMLLDVGMAGISLAGLVTAVFVGTGLINKEIEKRTVFVLIAKPISRVEFIVGKHLGLTAVLGVLVAAMTIIYFIVLSINGVSYPMGSLMVASAYTLLELSLITAIAILFGVFTSSLLSTLLTFAVYIMGHLSPDIVELAKLADNPSLEKLTQNMYLVLPDLSRLNLRNAAVYGNELMPPPLELLSHAAYGVAYTVLLLAIANLIFSRRQF